jgi:outer membrane protein assembly factor BamB
MVYDRRKVKQAVTSGRGSENAFASAELAVGEGNLEGAARLMESCLASLAPEDLDFRATVNQQLYQVYRRLAQASIRGRNTDQEYERVVRMGRCSTTLGNEIEGFFALADVYERKQEYAKAAEYLRAIVTQYGGYQYGVSSLYAGDRGRVETQLKDVIKRAGLHAKGIKTEKRILGYMDMMRKTLPLYYSALSPVERNLKVRAEDVAVSKLVTMQTASPAFAKQYEGQARAALKGQSAAAQQNRLIEFPATKTGQKTLQAMLDRTTRELAGLKKSPAKAAELRRQLWRLADMARLCRFRLPETHAERLLAPAPRGTAPLTFPLKNRALDMEEARGTAWLTLERRGQLDVSPELMFLGGRVKKKFDSKFVLYALETASGKTVWKATEPRGAQWFEEIRLKGKGDEAGFFEAFVHGDIVVVHGLFDVLAFSLADGKLVWRYRVPFDFDISYALVSGDLLVLAGEGETIVLYLPTEDPRGEVVWQETEQGALYGTPYFYGDRLVTVRKMPFNVTIRYRGTGKLIGRMEFDDLTLRDEHPVLDGGPKTYPMARDGRYLALCGGGYYLMLDIEKMTTVWKRLMDKTANTAVRMELRGDYLAVTKRDFDLKSLYMLSSRTGALLWYTKPDTPDTPQPVHSMLIRDGKLYGLRPLGGGGFFLVGIDCKTGKNAFRPNRRKGYSATPVVRLRRTAYGDTLVAEVKDRQDFELAAFEMKTGKLKQRVRVKGIGDFGEHGRASATVQNGCLILHGKKAVKIAAPGG